MIAVVSARDEGAVAQHVLVWADLEDMMTRGVESPKAPSNIAKRNEFNLGDIKAGFAAADEIVEMSFKTAAVHQAYIEPQGCVARFVDANVEPHCARRRPTRPTTSAAR